MYGKQPRLQLPQIFSGAQPPANFCKQIIQSSFSEKDLQDTHTSPSRNGLVYAAYHAYSHHHHLTICPEDVWFSVLSQLNFYINAHAEELRDYFIAHKAQKKLTVYTIGTIHTVDFGLLARYMTKEIQNNAKDPDLQEWIMPDFTTTTDSDRAVAAVLMMGAMQKYFSCEMAPLCGIPSVTLLGERADWEKIHNRLNKLSKFGDELTKLTLVMSMPATETQTKSRRRERKEQGWTHCSRLPDGSCMRSRSDRWSPPGPSQSPFLFVLIESRPP
ncbi:uncharacterized protein M421DRAFT_89100 [Didymella exigua CBS 183.55]|uniref:Uncharacterized protein n=1 Tax=Didymella exigua CBS 183.55 TaxID=1150837 RepID=A0A6A5RY33_9PLEO|nr:uncharacterized protein M421DRAFT_89100 [Didymella exigua CBS 183.55]KAF1932742.1 hypothetical protein M421DRAFT_89100 [Didymella exigua CBS 183.55]